LQITLHAEGVAAPSHAAAVTCREVVDFYLDAIGKADLTIPPPEQPGLFFNFRITGPELSADERRALHETWILSKAFQDLMRGVRASLEEAFFFIELLAIGRMTAASASTIEDILAPFRADAAKRSFPSLLAHVNAGLERPLDFIDAYQSMQDARNCLEHRGGIVGNRDIGEHGSMLLRFPRVKMFLLRGDLEVDLTPGLEVIGGEEILMRLDERNREFKLGERIILGAADFDEIAFACYFFGDQLARRLPKSPNS
jgi:hypothetical protein